jgi:TonB-linked SusC/RagA family outer membrane protein
MRKLLMLLMCALLTVGQLWAQNRTIHGTVLDENGKPIERASVVIKGTTKGTTTDAEGNFTLTNVPPTTKFIVISSLNFLSREINISNKNTIDVRLESKNDELNEVVVSTGIAKQKKSEYAGAVSSITQKNIEDRPVGSFDQLFQGQVPGLLALTQSGQPGNSTNVIIRGTTSIAGGSTPLYVIDGIPVEASVFQGLNPNDFLTVDILKDAAAAALYGSRGSAGVIVITTKRGVAGKMRLSYNAQMGIKSKPEFGFRPMTTAELLKAQEDYGKIAGGGIAMPGWYYSPVNPRYATLTPAQQAAANQTLDSISKINTNWADYMFRNGPFSNHQLVLSGGAGKTRIYSSLELYNETGTTPRTDMKRISLRNNVDYADDKLSFSLSSSLSYVRRNFQQSTVTNSTGNPFLAVNITTPYALVYKPDGTYATGVGTSFVGANQLDLTYWDRNYNDQLKAVLGTTTSYKIIKNVVASLTTGIDFRETQGTNYGSQLAFSRLTSTTPTGKAGFQSESLTRFFQADVRPSINYSNTFRDKHKVSLGVYGEYLTQAVKSFSLTGYGIDPRTPNTPAAITQGNADNQLYANVGGGKSQNALTSGLAMGTYTLNDKYTVSGSFRYDGSSKLPSNNRWTSFYSVSGIWNIGKENFLMNTRWLNEWRLRASYGGSGDNDNFPSGYGDYGYFPTYAANGNYAGLTTLYVSNVGNPLLTWETTYQLNVGTDFSLFNKRVYGSIDVYDKRTKNLFVQKQLSAEAGGYSILVNGGVLQNKGIELDISYDVVKNKDFTWTINGKAAYNKNNVLSLGGLNSYTVGTSLVTVGKPLGSHFEVKWAGVDASSGAPLYYDLSGKITPVYSANNKVQEFGTWEAPWKGGFGTNLNYKNFGVSILFSWQQGATKVDNLEYFVENPVGFLSGGYNQSSSLNFWKKPGDIATTPSPLYSTNFSSKIIHDASFLRFRDLMITYKLPESTVQKIKFISKATFYVQGSNLFIWTNWRGMDPEAGPSNINLSEYPNPRALTAGLNVTF